MISPEPNFFVSFDALERSLRNLPGIDAWLPTPVAPEPDVLRAWLAPYREWALPQVYLDFVGRYGGVSSRIPSVGVGIEPVASVLDYRRSREAIGDVFETPEVMLSPLNMDGDLRLIFGESDQPPRVGFFDDDDNEPVYEADSFALYLWNALFFFTTIYQARFSELISLGGVPPQEVEAFNRRLPGTLRAAGFDILGADSRIVCGQREHTRFSLTVRGANVSVSMGNATAHNELARAHQQMRTVLQNNR